MAASPKKLNITVAKMRQLSKRKVPLSEIALQAGCSADTVRRRIAASA